jgi:stage II sporulation protein AA (anti-sigma F factor antagonist)
MEENSGLRITSRLIGKDKNIALLTLDGYIDTMTAPLVKKELVSVGDNIYRFIIHFGGVDYVSSAGWGVILGRIKENREKGGDIVFVKMNKDVHSIYELLDLKKLIRHFSKIEDGINYFGYTVTEASEEEKHEKPEPISDVEDKTVKLEETVRSIVQDDPLLNLFQINQRLRGSDYGFNNINIFKSYFILRRLGLNTREKRLYFAWQQARKSRKG